MRLYLHPCFPQALDAFYWMISQWCCAADTGGVGFRGAPAWMGEGESSPSEDGRRVDGTGAEALENQQARMRREFEAERQQYKLNSARGAPASSAPQARHL